VRSCSLVCGEALFDLFADTAAVGGLRFDGRIGGSPFNVAIGLARLGRRSTSSISAPIPLS